MQRYHPRGCRKPLGAHLRYVLRDRQGRLLGCAQFEYASRKLACRDEWIGWQGEAFHRHLKLVVRHSRYLLLPRSPGMDLRGKGRPPPPRQGSQRCNVDQPCPRNATTDTRLLTVPCGAWAARGARCSRPRNGTVAERKQPGWPDADTEGRRNGRELSARRL